MSLKIWLPFVNDVNNQGLAGNINSYSLNGFASDSNGKIGKCYSGLGIYHLSEDILDNTWSLALWVKATAWGVNNDILLCKNNNESTSCQFYMSVINGKTFNIGINGGSSTGQYSYTFSTNTWYHLAATYNGSTYKLYLNGNEVKSASTTAAKINGLLNIGIGCRSTNVGGTTQTGYTATKYYNDVRIYDHCLSPKEVKELSKGLVLHYPLNRGGFGQDNLLLNSTIPMSGSGATGIMKYITDDGLQKVVAESSNGNWCAFGNHNTKLPLTKGDSFTFSMMIKSPDSTKKPTVYFQSGLGYYSMQGTMSNNWSIIYYTGIWNIDNLSTNIHLGFSSAPGTYYIKYFKLEKGSIITPWAPNSADSLYSAMGLDDGIEYDVSGYQNNGSITGDLTCSSDTPRYSICTSFNGTDYASLVSPCTEVKTISFWANWDVIPSGQSVLFVDGKSHIGFGLMVYGILCGTSGIGNFKTFSKTSLVVNEWYHFVIVNPGDATSLDRKLYINGVEQTAITSTSNWTYGVDQLQLGKRVSTSDGFKGKMSDFRMYSTALSADDILELYHTPVSIANNGTLMTQGEILEV